MTEAALPPRSMGALLGFNVSRRWHVGYTAALGAVTVVSLFIGLVLGQVNLANSSMLYLLAVMALPVYAEALNGRRIFGVPLGYFVVCHGILMAAAIVMAGFVNRQDAIDHWHGANEEP